MNKLKYGFTLVELLIVMTILSILSTLAFVSFQSYVTMGKEAKKTTEIKKITTAIEITKEGNNFLPIPDSSTHIVSTGSGWVSGILGENVRRQLGLDRVPYDEQFGANYTYSTFDKKYYEIGTVVTQSSNFSSLSPKAQATDLKAKIEGNYNGFFLKYNSGGLIYYVSTPSVTLSNPSEGIQANQLTDNIVINGEENLPYTYAQVLGETGTGKLFTPKILWSGADCGPTTASEIKDFVENLQLSFTGLSQEMYTSLLSKQTYEEKLEYGVNVINTYGNCKIEKPKVLPSVSLLSCGGKDLSFEGYASGELLTDDCLFDMTGSGKWQIVNGGSAGQRSLRSIFANGESGSIIYKTQITTPMIFSFDYLRNNTNRRVNFYVNNNLMADTELHTTWTTISTMPLPAGEYEFRFEFNTDNSTKFVTLDNLRFENVGLTHGFEKGNSELSLTTSGAVWYLNSTNKTEGNFSLRAPILVNTSSELVITKQVTDNNIFSFDYFTSTPNYLSSNPTAVFVNGLYLYTLLNLSGTWTNQKIFLPKNQQNTVTFRAQNTTGGAHTVLFDNVSFESKQLGLGHDLYSLGNGIDFQSNLASGWRVMSGSLSGPGSYYINSGHVQSQTKNLSFSQSFSSPKSLQFFYSTYYSSAYFSINGVSYLSDGNTNGSPKIFKTTPLPIGSYNFNFGASAGGTNTINFDGLEYVDTYLNLGFDEVDQSQKEEFVFTHPWLIVPGTLNNGYGTGTHYLNSGIIGGNTKSFKITKTLSQPKKNKIGL